MTDFTKYIPRLVKFGFDKEENVSDFWFKHKTKIAPTIFGGTGNGDQFSLLVRWESEIGKECSKAIRQFIAIKQTENIQARNILHRQGMYSIKFAEIDFNTFTFNYQQQEYNLKSFSALFSTSQITGFADLRGINLNGISINDSVLKNGFLAQCNFSNSNLQQVQLENINFVKANFYNARLVSIRLDKESTFSNANFKNAFLNAIKFTDKILGDGIEINEISYFSLIKKSLFKEKHGDKRNHTEFLMVDTKDITSYDLVSLKKYTEWYMTVSRKIRDSKHNYRQRLSIIYQIIISKYWTSYSVFGAFTFFTILLLASFFHLTSNNFKIPCELIPVDFFDCIYFVVVTFTTLGYGDISPINWGGQVFVIITALTGYLFLGTFIYLLSKKMDTK